MTVEHFSNSETRVTVARTGFEPVVCWLRTNCPRPLDERAILLILSDLGDIDKHN